MATFTKLIQSGKAKGAYLKKQAALSEVSHNFLSIKDLDDKPPNVRVFNRYEVNANSSLEMLKSCQTDLNIPLLEANPEIFKDESYIADLAYDRGQTFDLLNVISEYTEFLKNKGITYPPVVKPIDLSRGFS